MLKIKNTQSIKMRLLLHLEKTYKITNAILNKFKTYSLILRKRLLQFLRIMAKRVTLNKILLLN